MCGIAGVLNLNSQEGLSEEVLLRMVASLAHRGPDQSGVYLAPDIHLGHARLSILDLAGGTQPLRGPEGHTWMVYNGEVFNYIELKQDLEKRGHRFFTQTDTEVILHLYEEMGPACLEKLNGQFALAIWNSQRRELFLARDRVGICPLYYTTCNGRFLFASEIKALFMDDAVPREIDPVCLQQVFTCWTPVGTRTTFSGVRTLRPGHYMIVRPDTGGETQQPYWQLPYYPPGEHGAGAPEEAAEHIRELLEDAVRLRLRADVPVGAYLSGGLDSSLITGIIAGRFNNRLTSFSLGFAEKAFDESDFQAELVRSLNTDHRQTRITNQQVNALFPAVIQHCETPLLRTGPVPLFMLSGLVRENDFKVVLTGEGADEVFGGYNIYKEAKVRAFWARQPESRLRPLLLERLYPYVFSDPARNRAFLRKFFAVSRDDLADPFFSHQKRWANTRRCTGFFSSALRGRLRDIDPAAAVAADLPAGFASRDIFSRAQWLEMNLFMSNYLLTSQGDRVAMAHSVELRLPFLDHRVIEFAARLPAHWKIRGLDEKYLLKQAFRGRLPESIIRRAKQPYRAPAGPTFFSAAGGDWIADLAGEEQLAAAGIFAPQKVRNLMEKCRARGSQVGSETENMAVAGILSTQLIHEQFVKNCIYRQVRPVRPDRIVRREEGSADDTVFQRSAGT